MKTKEEFHKLIDMIEDDLVLKNYYELILRLNMGETGRLWESLKENEKSELMISFEESHDPNQLISHDEVKKQHEKWLKK